MGRLLTATIRRATVLVVVTLFALIAVNPPATVWADFSEPSEAASDRDITGIITDTSWYDPTDLPCSLEGRGLVGGDNAEIVYNFLTSKGLNGAQASGIIGNLKQESGLRPTTIQTVGGSAKGIAQWEGDRFDNLVEFAEKKGKTWEDLDIQLQFLWSEMPHQFAFGHLAELQAILPAARSSTSSLTAVRMSKTPSIAAQAFELTFERAGDPEMANRIKFAEEAFDRFGERSTDTTTGDDQLCASDPVETGKFIVYNQYDPRWRDKPYGSTTIAEGGCGPSAMAMIVTALLGKRVEPPEVASYAASQGMYIPGVGSSWAIAGVVAKHYGLKATQIGPSASKINAVLGAGGYIVTSGSGPLPFTTGGHYIVIRGIDPDGNWLIGDSGHRATNNRSWSPAHMLSIMNEGNIYAITK